MTDLEETIKDLASEDGQYAIAYALLQVAEATRGVGVDLDRVATAINNVFMDRRIAALVQSVETIAERRG